MLLYSIHNARNRDKMKYVGIYTIILDNNPSNGHLPTLHFNIYNRKITVGVLLTGH